MNPPPLPAELSFEEKTSRMIRVNLAGEYGAKRIYEGQLSVLRTSPCATELEHMKAQELTHLEAFSRLAQKRQVRPTLLEPLWHVAGYALGVATAMMGEKMAMTCTAAVEEVIDDHYAKQLEILKNNDLELSHLIQKFREEEDEHRKIALEHGAEAAPGAHLASEIIKAGTKIAIWLSTRL